VIASSIRRAGLAALAALLGCATAGTTSGSATSAARTAPDDGDLWNLTPADAVSIAEIDMAALSRSPWSRTLVTGGFAEDRADRLRDFGYDVFADVERLLVAGTEGGASGTESLTVARGRFDEERVSNSFLASTPGAAAGRWRESPLWEGRGRALALVTSRTLVQGTPEAVRGAIDAAWGVAPDAHGGPLAELRRVLDQGPPRPAPPALTLLLVLTDQMKARAAGFVDVPDGLRRVGARLDLGRDLDLDVRALLDGPPQAEAAADIWRASLRDLGKQRLLLALGLGPIVQGASVKAEGAQARVRVHIPESKREGLSDRLLLILQQLVQSKPKAAPP
jgi:hypothetical protein